MVIKSYFLLDKTIEYDGMTATIVVCDMTRKQRACNLQYRTRPCVGAPTQSCRLRVPQKSLG